MSRSRILSRPKPKALSSSTLAGSKRRVPRPLVRHAAKLTFLHAQCHNAHARVSEGDFPHTFDARKGGQLFDAGISISASVSAEEAQSAFPAHAATPARGSSTVPAALRRSPSKTTTPPGSPKATLPRVRRGTSAQQLEMEDEGGAGEHQAASSTPLQRQESDVATEVAEAADLGGFDGHRDSSADPGDAHEQPHASSPRSSAQRREQLIHEDNQEPSSDPLAEIPPLRSESRPPVSAASDDTDAQKNVLKQQTSLLLAQLTEAAPQTERAGRTRSRTALTRKKVRQTRAVEKARWY